MKEDLPITEATIIVQTGIEHLCITILITIRTIRGYLTTVPIGPIQEDTLTPYLTLRFTGILGSDIEFPIQVG